MNPAHPKRQAAESQNRSGAAKSCLKPIGKRQGRRPCNRDTLFHSDRGRHYTSGEIRAQIASPTISIRDRVVKVVLKEIDTCVPRDPEAPFDLQHYFANPGLYTGRYMDYIPHFTILMNCIYWSPESPRVLSREDVREMFAAGQSPRLKVVGDISCDIEGGVEITLKATDQDSPVFVYDPARDEAVPGVEGNGPVVMAVDNLPCELPRESSMEFGKALMPFAGAIARADYSASFEALDLPPEIKRATILHHGELTPDYRQMNSFLE